MKSLLKKIRAWYWENVLTTNVYDLQRKYPQQYKSWCSGRMKAVRHGGPLLEAYKEFRVFMVKYLSQV